MEQLDKLLLQYLNDFRRLYYPSLLCSREDLNIKKELSYTLKEDLNTIKDLFYFSKDYELWYEGVLLPETKKILESHAKLLQENMK